MEDVICNIRRYTAPIGPQPGNWWISLQGRVIPVFGNAWIGTQAAFVGRTQDAGKIYRELTTGRRVPLTIGTVFIPRPGNYAPFPMRTRADVMAFVVHELRHAGQFYSLFRQEYVRGQRLSCPNISGRIAEVDAWLNTNHWMVNSGLSRIDFNDAVNFWNNGRTWSVDDLWDAAEVTQYRQFYDNSFDAPPAYTCPGSAVSATDTGTACIDPIVLMHL